MTTSPSSASAVGTGKSEVEMKTKGSVNMDAVAVRKKANLIESMGLAGVTAIIVVNFTHPIEVVKTRMQVVANYSMGAMLRTEGYMSLYKGIQAGYCREASYTSIKLGAYGPIKTLLGDRGDAPFYIKFLSGSVSGALGSFVGNPFDVMKTMQMAGTDNSLGSLMKQMYSEQGIAGFYRGIEANIMRAIVLNGTKMACYDVSKDFVSKQTGWSRKDLSCQFVSATISGFAMTCTVSPFDNIRTRLMNQPTTGTLQYTGFVDCATKILRNEGPLAFYRGFLPIWGRFAPQATLQLVIFEMVLKLTGYAAL